MFRTGKTKEVGNHVAFNAAGQPLLLRDVHITEATTHSRIKATLLRLKFRHQETNLNY